MTEGGAEAAPTVEQGGDAALLRADESVARRFSRLMNATTSPWGMITDPPVAGVATGALLLLLLPLATRDPPLVPGEAVLAGIALPVVAALAGSVLLRGARRRVVAWLASLPFPLENMNAVLNGLGEFLDVTYQGPPPARDVLNAALDAVHPDAFVVETFPEERVVRIRIGVVDSKRNPARTNHVRFVRVRELVGRVLVPMGATAPVQRVRVKA